MNAMQSASLENTGIAYYDIQLQKEELDRKLNSLNTEHRARKEENDKLCLFYQHELRQRLERMEKEKTIWEGKRERLQARCHELQECIKPNKLKYSRTNKNLNDAKENYCRIMMKLLPEWQGAVQRKQMDKLSEYEKTAALIQQRRFTADIAFEKEKKLLSLLSIRQLQVHRLQEEEKQEALKREQQRTAIKKCSEQELDQQLTQLLRSGDMLRPTTHVDDEHEDDGKRTENQAALSNLHKPSRQHQSMSMEMRKNKQRRADENEVEPQREEEEQEEYGQEAEKEKEKEVVEEKENQIKDQEGDETQPVPMENDSDRNDAEIMHADIVHDADADSVNVHNAEQEEDTSRIERAIGLIEMNHGKNNAPQNTDHLRQEDQNEPVAVATHLKPAQNTSAESQTEPVVGAANHENAMAKPEAVIEPQKPVESQMDQSKPKPIENSSLSKTSRFRASYRKKISRNRLQFSLLAFGNDENEDKTEQPAQPALRSNVSRNVISNAKLSSVNDFEEEKVVQPDTNSNVNDNDMSDDEFDF